MTAGRKPKPTNLKLIQGTYRADRANPSESNPKVAIPPCPKFLQGEARKQYDKMAKKLARIGLMTELDDMALSMLLVKSTNGQPMMNPYLAIANQAIKKVRAMLVEFGMSPSSRSRISAVGGGQDRDNGEWFDLLND